MKAIALLVLLAGCGGDDGGGGDGGEPAVDAAAHDHDAGDSPIDAAPASAECEDYCATIMASCTTALAQYKDLPTCLASCGIFPAGEPGAGTGDSMACRTTHLAMAADSPDPECRYAGPSGGGVCGAPCDAYCDLVMEVCDFFADDAECMEVCSGYPEVGLYSARVGRGDSVECRIFHATLSTTDPEHHCGTASPGSGPCQDQ